MKTEKFETIDSPEHKICTHYTYKYRWKDARHTNTLKNQNLCTDRRRFEENEKSKILISTKNIEIKYYYWETNEKQQYPHRRIDTKRSCYEWNEDEKLLCFKNNKKKRREK